MLAARILLVLVLVLGTTMLAQAEVILQDDFTGPLTWTTSDASVYIKDNDFLFIGTNGNSDDWAEKAVSISLTSAYPIVLEQRMKLESGGLNFRLPQESIYFEDDSELFITYLPSIGPGIDGWGFGYWTGSDDHPVPGSGWWTTATADYWAVTRIVLTPTGGELFVKPDDSAKGWFSDEFSSVASGEWTHSSIERIRFSQPWDSVNYVDYITIIPEPSCLLLLGVGGLAFLRRRRK